MSIMINVVTRVQDNMDGGYSIKVFNSMEEMLAAHPAVRTLVHEGASEAAIADLKETILCADDEYEYGYLDEDVLELEQNADGSYRLAKPLSFHAGQ